MLKIFQMQLFFYQTLLSMSDSFYNATKEEKMTQSLIDFCKYYVEKLKIFASPSKKFIELLEGLNSFFFSSINHKDKNHLI